MGTWPEPSNWCNRPALCSRFLAFYGPGLPDPSDPLSAAGAKPVLGMPAQHPLDEEGNTFNNTYSRMNSNWGIRVKLGDLN